MKFTEEKAREVIKKFTLSNTTIAVWRTRGKIPDKYFKNGYKKTISISDRVHDKLLTVLSSEKINLRALASTIGMAPQKIKDARLKKSSFNTQEYIAIKVALNNIRVEAKKFVESYRMKERFSDRETESLKKFLKNSRELVIVKVFKDKKIINWRNGKQVAMRPEDYRNMVDNLAVFILETSLPEKLTK